MRILKLLGDAINLILPCLALQLVELGHADYGHRSNLRRARHWCAAAPQLERVNGFGRGDRPSDDSVFAGHFTRQGGVIGEV